MKKYIGVAMIAAGLLVPAGLRADDHKRTERERTERYYDRQTRDWHEWNHDEDRAYRDYLKEQRREYRAYSKANKRDQQAYWTWRHHQDMQRRSDMPKRSDH